MRNFDHLEERRVDHPIFGMGDKENGVFDLKLPGSRLTFTVIASNGGGWEHVSVSTEERIPRWHEMQNIKDLFFKNEEAVMQLHPPKSMYENNHPYCLHLWRPLNQDIPLPDMSMV